MKYTNDLTVPKINPTTRVKLPEGKLVRAYLPSGDDDNNPYGYLIFTIGGREYEMSNGTDSWRNNEGIPSRFDKWKSYQEVTGVTLGPKQYS